MHPEKVKYYLERRDPEFEAKMREILLVYWGRWPCKIRAMVNLRQ